MSGYQKNSIRFDNFRQESENNISNLSIELLNETLTTAASLQEKEIIVESMIQKMINSRVSREHFKDFKTVVEIIKSHRIFLHCTSELQTLIIRYLSMHFTLNELCSLLEVVYYFSKNNEGMEKVHKYVISKLATSVNETIIEIYTRKSVELVLSCLEPFEKLDKSNKDVFYLISLLTQTVSEYFNENLQILGEILSVQGHQPLLLKNFRKTISIMSEVNPNALSQRLIKDINLSHELFDYIWKINNAALMMREYQFHQIIENDIKLVEIVEYKLQNSTYKDLIQGKIYDQLRILETINNIKEINFIKKYSEAYNQDVFRIIFENNTEFKPFNEHIIYLKNFTETMPNFMVIANHILRSFNEIEKFGPVNFLVSSDSFRFDSNQSVKIDFISCQKHIFQGMVETPSNQTKIKNLGYALSDIYSLKNSKAYLGKLLDSAPETIKEFLYLMLDDSRNQDLTLEKLINNYTLPASTETLTNHDRT